MRKFTLQTSRHSEMTHIFDEGARGVATLKVLRRGKKGAALEWGVLGGGAKIVETFRRRRDAVCAALRQAGFNPATVQVNGR